MDIDLTKALFYMARRHVMVRLAPLTSLLQWCDAAIDFKDETDDYAAKAYGKLKKDISEQPVEYGCKHAEEMGFICHECGKLV